MTSARVIVSLFPGIDGLGRGFAEVFPDACLLRGPDLIYGTDIREWHLAAGIAWGVIAGPPCQTFSLLARLIRAQGREPRYGDLFPEFIRCVGEGQPDWWLSENVPQAPRPEVPGYHPAQAIVLDNRWVGGEQHRRRHFTFGVRLDLPRRTLDLSPDLVALEMPLEYAVDESSLGNGREYYRSLNQSVVGSDRRVPVAIGGSGKLKNTVTRRAVETGAADKRRREGRGITYPTVNGYFKLNQPVTAAHAGSPVAPRLKGTTVTGSDGGPSVPMGRYSVEEAARLQGFPPGFLDDAPFTQDGKRRVIAQAVPRWMAESLARAVKRAMEE